MIAGQRGGDKALCLLQHGLWFGKWRHIELLEGQEEYL